MVEDTRDGQRWRRRRSGASLATTGDDERPRPDRAAAPKDQRARRRPAGRTRRRAVSRTRAAGRGGRRRADRAAGPRRPGGPGGEPGRPGSSGPADRLRSATARPDRGGTGGAGVPGEDSTATAGHGGVRSPGPGRTDPAAIRATAAASRRPVRAASTQDGGRAPGGLTVDRPAFARSGSRTS